MLSLTEKEMMRIGVMAAQQTLPLSVACKTVIKAVLFLCSEYITVHSCRVIFTVVFGEKTLTIKDKKNIIKQYDIRRNSLHQSPGVC